MADIENPNPDGGGAAVAAMAARAEPDDDSGCGMLCGLACVTCTFLVVGVVLPLLFYVHGHSTAGGVATALLVAGILGFVSIGSCCCVVVVRNFLCGNVEGTPQDDLLP
ncbi:hypothetical protein ACP70R_036038 [Stipagrostis hirtigluma subsp. patula]